MKRVLAMLLAAIMVLTMAPGMVFAAADDTSTADGKELKADMVAFFDAEYNQDAVYELQAGAQEVTPEVVVWDDTVQLSKDMDYSVSYENNNRITDAAKVIVSGIGNYSGRIEKTFKIVKPKENIASATVTMDIPKEGLFYNAKAQEPAIKEVSLWDGTKLTPDDYEVIRYENNIDAGYANVLITGTGAYEGVASGGFEIQRLPIKKLTLEIEETQTDYNGQTQLPKITQVKANDSVILAEKDYWTVYKKNTTDGWTEIYDGGVRDAGDYTVAVRVDSNIANCSADWFLSEEKAYKINPVSVAGQKITLWYTDLHENSMLDAGDSVSVDLSRVTPENYETDKIMYQWKINGSEIPGATSATWLCDGSNTVGTLTCEVTFTGSTTGKIVSDAWQIDKKLLTGTIEIENKEGTLTVSTPSNKDVTAADYKITWYRNGVAIAGNNTTKYKLEKPADLGNTFSVSITGIAARGWSGTLYSRNFIVDGESPAAPKITATAGDKKVTVKWKKPEENGAPITGYKLTVTKAASKVPVKTISIGAAKTECIVDGLQNGTEYTFTMIATNEMGESEPSEAVKATPKVPEYTIRYVMNGGTNSKLNPAKYTKETATFTLKKPTRKGYTFGGWYTNSKFTAASKVTGIKKGSTGNKTLYAKWTATPYKITYYRNNGTLASGSKTEYNITTATFTLKKPTRKGYTFDGWYTTNKYKKKETSVVKGSTGNKVFYAKWIKVTVEKAKTPVLTNLKGRSLKVSYSATTGAKGYQIQYSTSRTFSKAVTKTTTAKTYTAKKLQKGKTYWVRVRAYKTDSKGYKVYGNWSTVKSKKITK